MEMRMTGAPAWAGSSWGREQAVAARRRRRRRKARNIGGKRMVSKQFRAACIALRDGILCRVVRPFVVDLRNRPLAKVRFKFRGSEIQRVESVRLQTFVSHTMLDTYVVGTAARHRQMGERHKVE